MEVYEHQNVDLRENRVDIYYSRRDQEILDLLQFIEGQRQIIGKDGTETVILTPQEIYYFEAVEKKCFAYLKQQVIQVTVTLQVLEERLGQMGFARINKSMIVNLRKVRRLKAGLNMRMTAVLTNGEQLIINRSYKNQVSEAIRQLYQEVQHEDY